MAEVAESGPTPDATDAEASAAYKSVSAQATPFDGERFFTPAASPFDATVTSSLDTQLDTELSSEKQTIDDRSKDQSQFQSQSPPPEDGDAELQRTATALSTASTRPAMPLGQEIIFVALVCCGQIFTQACLGQAIAILPYIRVTYGDLSPGELSWVPAAFSLTVGTFILLAGRTGDIIGHKKVFMAGWAWLSLWSLLAGLSAFTQEQIFLDVCRAMQGIGAAMLLPCGLAILGRTYPPGRRKDMVFAIFGATAPNGSILGSVFAGISAQFLWWPWTFWLMAICAAVIFGLCFPIIPSTGYGASKSKNEKFDFLGAVLGVSGLVLFNAAWNQAPLVGWQEPYIIVILILGILAFLAFLYVESRAAQPLIPVSQFNATMGFVLGCVALGWSSFGIWVYYFWQFLLNLRKQTVLLSTADFTPVCVAGLTAALLTGRLLGIWPPEVIMLIALCAFCTGNILLATMPVNQIYWAQTFVSAVVTPFGMDMSFPAATLILSNSVSKKHQGIAASLVVTVVNYSISIGLGIAGTVDRYIDPSQTDLLLEYRGALYAGIGLSGCGIMLAVVYTIYNAVVRSKEKRKRGFEGKEKE